MNNKTTNQNQTFERIEQRLKDLKRENGIKITVDKWENDSNSLGKYSVTKWTESKINPQEFRWSTDRMYYNSMKELEIAVDAITTYLMIKG